MMAYGERRPRLSAAERAELWTRWKQGERLSDIATALARAPGTIYSRIRKAGGIPERPRQRAARPKPGKLTRQPRLCRLVAGKLEARWSPQQIAG
ncbi:MAG: helix-turn-helix domain-containing protein [Gemmatimonadetes bacterium]|nr:helix-turn-helix domain-containing protein [Gemmatimonadota bacterium]